MSKHAIAWLNQWGDYAELWTNKARADEQVADWRETIAKLPSTEGDEPISQTPLCDCAKLDRAVEALEMISAGTIPRSLGNQPDRDMKRIREIADAALRELRDQTGG